MQEVSGSIPLGSTSLRPLGYGSASRSPKGEGCRAEVA
jgi:putative endonuclease